MGEDNLKQEITGNDTFGIVTLITGMLALIGCWIPLLNIISMIIAISGLIIGICSIVKFLNKRCRSCALAITGMILSVITICIGSKINSVILNNFPENFKSTSNLEQLSQNSNTSSKGSNTSSSDIVKSDMPTNLTLGQQNALKKAKSYLEYSGFSRSGLIEQLKFEKFSSEDAEYAVNNCGADWNEQALKKAKSYLEFSSFSSQGLIDQLKFEGFTQEQCEYAMRKIGYN